MTRIKMNRFIRISIILAIFCINLCGSNGSTTLDLKTLFNNAKILDGTIVQVEGFYIQKDDAAILFPDMESFENLDYRFAIWIGNYSEDVPASDRNRCDECHVVISGKYSSQSIGIFGLLKGQITEVMSFVESDSENLKGQTMNSNNPTAPSEFAPAPTPKEEE